MYFRDVEKKLCIVVDEPTVKVLAPDIDANALLCMGYVDHTAGLTYEAFAVANYLDGDYSIEWEAKDVGLKIRAGSLGNNIIMPIENKVLMNKFKFRIGLLETYYGDENVQACRAIKELDEFRHPEFPDDVAVFLAKEGIRPERIWARTVAFNGISNYIDDNTISIKVQLLNEPYEDFGVHMNDIIDCISFVYENGERILAHFPV